MARGARSFVVAGLMLAAASCGSKTGLFGPDSTATGGPADASADVVDEPVGCTPGRFTFELATAQLMFVLDRSGSMAFSLSGQDPVPPGEQSRWETLRDALFQTIVPFDQQLAMGAKFFPEVAPDDGVREPAEACRVDTGVAVPPARGQASAILNVFDTTEPRGGTPTSEAVRLAAEYLAAQRGVARTMVLATDGAPNCNGDLDARSCTCTTPRFDCASDPQRGAWSCLDGARTAVVIRDIFQDRGIPIFVIGIGSTERPQFLQVLDEMAVAGGRARAGTPKHYNVQSALELRDALATIQGSIARCSYLTPSAPKDPNAISVEIERSPVPRDTTHQDGWDWVDQAYGQLAFFGAACDRARRAPPSGVGGVVSCDE